MSRRHTDTHMVTMHFIHTTHCGHPKVTVMVMSVWLTSLLSDVNRPSHSWKTAILKFDLENPKSRSWPGSKLMAHISGLAFIFPFMAIRSFCPEIWQIKYLTLKIQGQGQVQGQNQWSHLRSRVHSMCLLLALWQSDHVLLRIWQIQYLTLKIQGQGHSLNQPKSFQVIYGSGPSIPPKMKEIWKVVLNL